VDCRVSDRDRVLPQAPLRVEWEAVDDGANQHQPVNQAVLVTVAGVLAGRARAAARAANQRGDFDEAQRVIRNMVVHLRGLAPDNGQIAAIIDRLWHDESELGQALKTMVQEVQEVQEVRRVR
jgi:hypothetical protein